MYDIFIHAHSGIRYLVLITVIITLVYSLIQRKSETKNVKLYLFSLVLIHIQFLVGLTLYFLSPKVVVDPSMFKSSFLRFYTVEHALMMFIAVILFTVGFSAFKKEKNSQLAYKKVFRYYAIAFIIMLLSIPWPFYPYGTQWI